MPNVIRFTTARLLVGDGRSLVDGAVLLNDDGLISYAPRSGEQAIDLAIVANCRAGSTGPSISAPPAVRACHETCDTVEVAVVDEASRHRGRPVAAHAKRRAVIRNVIRGEVSSIEHNTCIVMHARRVCRCGERSPRPAARRPGTEPCG